MNASNTQHLVLPTSIFEALEMISNTYMHEPDEQDYQIFGDMSKDAKIGEYDNSEDAPTMVIVDTDRITFITCDEDGVDVIKEFVITIL